MMFITEFERNIAVQNGPVGWLHFGNRFFKND